MRAISQALKGTVWQSGCQSWYLDANGEAFSWPWSMQRFRQDLRAPILTDTTSPELARRSDGHCRTHGGALVRSEAEDPIVTDTKSIANFRSLFARAAEGV